MAEPLPERAEHLVSRLACALQHNRAGRFVLDTARAGIAVAHGFRGERISLRASALTYISIFSLVPMLTVALALVERLGQHRIREVLHAFILDVLAPGIREESALALDRFIQTATSAAAGGVGLLILLISAGSLIKNLDSSLNEIWNVRRKRPLHVRIALYAGVLLLGPLVLALSLVGMGLLREIAEQLLPVPGLLVTGAAALISVAGFTLVYLVAPNAEVRLRAALAGGVTAGLAWDVAKHLYGAVAAELFRHSPLWGSVSAVPLFLIWIYLSWLLLLFGARLAYAVQFAWFRAGIPDLIAYARDDAWVAAQVSCALARLAQHGEAPPTIRRLSDETLVPVDVLEPIVERMIRGGLLRGLHGDRVEPSRPLGELTLADNALVVGGQPPGGQEDEEKPAPGSLDAILSEAEEAFLARLRTVRWADLPQADRALSGGAETPRLAGGQKP